MIPKNFEYLDSFVLPRELEQSKRALTEHITEVNRYKYFLKLKVRRDTKDHITMVPTDFPMQRAIYDLVYKAPDGKQQHFKIGCTQKLYQRIGRNYLQGSGANTGWLAPAMHEFLKEFGGEFEIYTRAFDDKITQMDDDIEVDYTPRLDTIEKMYQDKLNIKDGKKAVQEFFILNNFSYIIK
jgi:hypothetical protein|tara:strand:- start:478 stop:1023 length:546 start_codon:yes stop_codon:yes gene_type:complete